MPLKRARYIHVQTPQGKFNGFSVFMTPDINDPEYVIYSVAMCSRGDAFCRATGRAVCDDKEKMVCRVVDFPAALAALDLKSWGMGLGTPSRSYANQFAWVWKYFL